MLPESSSVNMMFGLTGFSALQRDFSASTS